jgi:hypothetical protein
MNKNTIARLVESKNLSFDEVSLMDSNSRVSIGLPAVIPQVDYTPTQQILDSVVPNFLGLRKAFGLDQEFAATPLFNTEQDTSGKMSDYYRREMVFSNNRGSLYTLVSEMAAHPLIAAALDIYASEATVPDPITGKVCWAEAEDPKIRAELNDLLARLQLDSDKAYSICFSMAEYGDNFEHVVADNQGVLALKYIHPSRLTRIEDKFGRLQGFAAGILTKQDAVWEENLDKMPDKVSYPWDIAHFRIQSTNRETCHGDPMTLPARRAYQQLKMIEDMLVLYRLSRGFDRDVYYVGVRGATATQSWRTTHEFRQQIRKNLGINPVGANMRQEFSPKTPDKDLFIPSSGKDDPTRVERQSGGGPQGDIPDVDHFRRVLLGALRIPAGYIGFETDTPARATLASQSARFARAVRRLQKAYIQGVRWICECHLIKRGFQTRDDAGRMTVAYKVKMSPINQVEELTKMEILTQQVDLVGKILEFARIDFEPPPMPEPAAPAPAPAKAKAKAKTEGAVVQPPAAPTPPVISPIIPNPLQFIAWVLRKNLNLSDSEIGMFLGDPRLGMTEDDVALMQLAESTIQRDPDFQAFSDTIKEVVEDARSDLKEGEDPAFVENKSDYQDSFFVANRADRKEVFDLDQQEINLRESLGVKEGDPIIKCPACEKQGMSVRKDEIEERNFLFCTKCGHSQ